MRSQSNQRIYEQSDLNRLMFIRHGRDLGFSVNAIRQFLDLSDVPDRPCEEADQLARLHLQDVENRLIRLTALKSELERMISNCKGGQLADCQIIAVLANHSYCLADDHNNPISKT